MTTQNDPNDNTNTNVNQNDDGTDDNAQVVNKAPESMDDIVDSIIANEAGNKDNKQNKQADGQQGNNQQQQNKGSVVTRQVNQQQNNQNNNQNAERIPLKGIPGAFADRQGNIVDYAGRPLARAGAEARVFGNASGPAKQMLDRLQAAETQLEAFNKAHNITAENKLTPQEIMMGHQIAAAWKKDKSATLQYLLSAAREAGISVEGFGQSIDMQAMKNIVKEQVQEVLKRFDPVFETWETNHKQTQLDQKVDNDIAEFFSEYPDAKIQEQAIGDIMIASGDKLSMHQAYTLALRYAHDQGLDWSKPLVDQVQGASKTANNSARTTGGNNRRELPPMGGGGNSTNQHRERKSAPADQSMDAIIREVFAENGIGANS